MSACVFLIKLTFISSSLSKSINNVCTILLSWLNNDQMNLFALLSNIYTYGPPQSIQGNSLKNLFSYYWKEWETVTVAYKRHCFKENSPVWNFKQYLCISLNFNS